MRCDVVGGGVARVGVGWECDGRCNVRVWLDLVWVRHLDISMTHQFGTVFWQSHAALTRRVPYAVLGAPCLVLYLHACLVLYLVPCSSGADWCMQSDRMPGSRGSQGLGTRRQRAGAAGARSPRARTGPSRSCSRWATAPQGGDGYAKRRLFPIVSNLVIKKGTRVGRAGAHRPVV